MKTCSKCKQSKPTTAFNKRASRKDGLQSNCRDCNKKVSAQYYNSNRVEHGLATSRNHRQYMERNRKYLFEYLSKNPCVDCGNTDVRVLEFDHVTDKKVAGVGKLARHAASLEVLETEIAKCEVRCRNCHQIVTYERAGGSWHDAFIELT